MSSKGLPIATLIVGASLVAAPGGAQTLVVANKAEATVSLIDLASGEVRATLPTGDGPHEVAVSPDGRRALITNYGTGRAPGSTLTLLDVAGAKGVKDIDLGDYGRPHGVTWLDERRALVTAEANQALLEVDVEAGEVLRAFDTGQEVSHMVVVAAGGSRAFVPNIGSGSVTVIDLENGERLANIPTGEGAEGITVAGDEVWITNREADTVTVLDATTLEKKTELESRGFPIRAAATPDGKRVLVTNARAGTLAVFDAATHERLREVSLAQEARQAAGRLFGDRFGDSSVPIGIVIDPSGERAWIAHSNADVVTELDLASWRVSRVLTAGEEPDGMAYASARVARDEDTQQDSPVE